MREDIIEKLSNIIALTKIKVASKKNEVEKQVTTEISLTRRKHFMCVEICISIMWKIIMEL